MSPMAAIFLLGTKGPAASSANLDVSLLLGDDKNRQLLQREER